MSRSKKDRPFVPRPSPQRTAAPTKGGRPWKLGFLSLQMCVLIGLYVAGFHALYEGQPWRRVTLAYQDRPFSEVISDLKGQLGATGITDQRSRPGETDGRLIVYRAQDRRCNEVLRDLGQMTGVSLWMVDQRLQVADGPTFRERSTANDLYDRMESAIHRLTGLTLW